MKELGEHGTAKLEEIEKKTSYIDTLGEIVSRDDEEPIASIRWPFKRMLNNHLMVKIDAPPKGGRIIMPQDKKSRPTKGTVIAVADDIKDIFEGDKVLYSQYAGYLLRFAGMPFCRALSYSEVIAVLHNDSPEIEGE
jgi:co-chaperonin GroES (HSP10)